MRGCLQGIGCLVLIAVVAVGGWMTRSRWLPRLGLDDHASAAAGSLAERWAPVTEEGSARAKQTVERLGSRTGPVFANIAPADLVSYLFEALSRELPPSAENVEAAVIGDRLYVRASVKLADFGGRGALGPLAGVLGDREPVRFGGTLDIVKPGLAEFRVLDLQVKDLSIPPPMIPRLLQSVARGRRPAGVSPDALPLGVPAYIADVRVHDGAITLYKTVP